MNIIIKANGSKKWIGGVYYFRNILFSISQNEEIMKNNSITIVCNEETEKEFRYFDKLFKIVVLRENNKLQKIRNIILYKLWGTDAVFTDVENILYSVLGISVINWIADFQYKHYPDFFDKKTTAWNDKTQRKAFTSNNPLVLSSQDSYCDFKKFYGHKQNVYVVPFVSFIEPELKKLEGYNPDELLKKFGLEENRFFLVSNQFWQNKNHIIVLRAIKLLDRRVKENVLFVFTGYPKDYKNPNYYNQLMELLDDQEIKPYVRVLGFIDRIEQLGLMRNAISVIQPSLFEGWGTVLEDAKVLNKRVLLSDIPVHQEQKYEKCILFNPRSAEDLAKNIEYSLSMIEKEQPLKIERMYSEAKEYSKSFAKLLNDMRK